MVVHRHVIVIAALAAKGATVVGHVIGHYWAAHTATHAAAAQTLTGAASQGASVSPGAVAAIAAATVAGPLLTVAYLDKTTASKLTPDGPPSVTGKKFKFSVAGNLLKGEFTTITRPLTSEDVLLLASYDEAKQKIVGQRLIKANRVEPGMAQAYGYGRIVDLP